MRKHLESYVHRPTRIYVYLHIQAVDTCVNMIKHVYINHANTCRMQIHTHRAYMYTVHMYSWNRYGPCLAQLRHGAGCRNCDAGAKLRRILRRVFTCFHHGGSKVWRFAVFPVKACDRIIMYPRKLWMFGPYIPPFFVMLIQQQVWRA